ncbi:hypothetical protein GCM10011494_02850 [Novosphingobium endophyticum]|uniref:Uncharacterized protein n=1 Tax=Novosphingobium endophyticum TaxID=1955250 RepID=A0A916TNZ2_9SPHN|nr:hypothetical protein [Novosphingobium endophyticum]GGB87937.1 hypothetical protein GCM10011494_02850 [Novosphingobium endophyticum]
MATSTKASPAIRNDELGQRVREARSRGDAEESDLTATFSPDELHDLMCTSLCRAGGRPCEQLISGHSGRVADIAFPDDQIVIEVKSITTDRGNDRAVQIRAGEILNEWAAKGAAPVLFGRKKVWLPDLQWDVARDLLKNLGNRVRREVAHANAQVRSTATALGFDQPRGLCVFVTPGNFAVGAKELREIVAHSVKPGEYRSLNAFLFVESWTEPGPPTKRLEVRPASRETMPGLPEGFMQRIMLPWFAMVSARVGEPVTVQSGLVDPEDELRTGAQRV